MIKIEKLTNTTAPIVLITMLRVATDDGGFRERTRATSSNQRFLFVEGTPAYVAKTATRCLSKIAVPADFDISELTKFWSQPKEGKGE